MGLPKILGYILIVGGVGLIVFSVYSSYNIFTGKVLPPEVFKVEKKQEPILPKDEHSLTPEEQSRKEMGEVIGEQIEEVLPVENILKLLNLLSWSILAGILIFAGSQISGLGVKLVKR